MLIVECSTVEYFLLVIPGYAVTCIMRLIIKYDNLNDI